MTDLTMRTDGATAERLKAFEEEDAELKKLLAEKLLEAAALREHLSRE
ncbi:hypothetical protein [Bradyrhizobium glycinis]|nr:hypothetical protein [Bradyrhizobium glycinis]MBH5371123.1 hypothetical protein [Bradyrhizobium glycinis]